MYDTVYPSVRRRRRRRRRAGRKKDALLFFLALLALILVVSSTYKKTEKIMSESQIIAAECKKAVAKGADEETLESLADIMTRQLGKPYVYGAAGPDAFDCSGLVQYVYGAAGIKLPRVVSQQSRVGSAVQKEDLKFGDIIFFSDGGETLTHTGLYIGSGYFMHSPATGEVVTLSNLSEEYYVEMYRAAVRVLK
ncbi:NlpC/P60 family protein [Sporobacter termitidis DSM 10068]|uniref:NlpC/P60 family protein n=1 Tax=Sporobacter termitidis DSM 10068 TaxID=1123282 RepID=A0A1M5WHP8_9FIRM|nr:C40 family peptidase [Sporobacter termitidis]SHH87026.1 NlpC/P60 family protein [Sporobacter termitidis DSM 10068]